MFEIRLVGSLVMHARHAAHAGRHNRAAVIAIFTPDNDTLFRLAFQRPEMAYHADDGIIRLGPGIGKKRVVEPVRRQFGKPP